MELALKQRLLGAAVLVALAVTFLPMLVTDPAPASGASDVPLRVPPIPQSDSQTREMPLVEPAAPAGPVLPSMAAPADAANTTADATSAPAQATAASPVSARLPATTAGGDYAVNFGSYATAADAARVIGALHAARLPGYQEPVVLPTRTVYRVRIGPYASQADAEAARLQAARVRDDVNAKVVVLDARAAGATPPAAVVAPVTARPATAPAVTAATAAAKPLPSPTTSASPAAPKAGVTPTVPSRAAASATTEVASSARAGTAAPGAATAPKAAGGSTIPAAPGAGPGTTVPVAAASGAGKPAAAATGFAIQLGAFASADDANRLRDRARAAGFTAFVEPVRSEHGTLNRVRIGPVADRADADRLRAQVASKLGVDGLVRPHP